MLAVTELLGGECTAVYKSIGEVSPQMGQAPKVDTCSALL